MTEITDTEILDYLEKLLLAKDGKWRQPGRHLLIDNGERKKVRLHRGEFEQECRRLGTGNTVRGAVLNAMQSASARALAAAPENEVVASSEDK